MRESLPALRHFLHSALFISAAFLGGFSAHAQDHFKNTIQVSGHEVFLPANGQAYLDSLRQNMGKPVQLIIQFASLPSFLEQKEMAASNLQLLDFIGNNAYVANLNPGKVLPALHVRSCVPVQPSWKISDELVRDTAAQQHIAIVFSCAPGTTIAAATERLKVLGGRLLNSPLSEHACFEASIPGNQLKTLAAWNAVKAVGPIAHDEPLNFQSQQATKVNIAHAPFLAGGYGLLGDSITVGIGDNTNGLYHIDTRDRITNFNYAGYNNHGQHVNGTVGGAGIMDPLGEGFAPHAKLIDHLYSFVWQRTGPMAAAYNMSVTNNSYANRTGSCSYAGSYDIYAQQLDSIALAYPNVLQVFASGNDGGATCTPFPQGFATVVGGYQAAKNVIVVGNAQKNYMISGGSSKGPVKDGRIRPDITAVGTAVYSTKGNDTYLSANGTSMASPQVAGAAALLQQHYKRTHSGVYPTSLLTKALLMNAAQDLGAPGPDYRYGYGMMDLRRSLNMMDNSWYTTGAISNGGSQTPVTISIPANTAQLKVMLIWHDVPASTLASTQLVNDIDLTVTDPSSVSHLPAILNPAPAHVADTAVNGADHLNNVEQVVIDNPASGSYTVGVAGYAVPRGPQAYTVAYDIIPKGISIATPFAGDAYPANSPLTIYWNASNDPNTFSIDFSANGGTNWTNLSSSVPTLSRQYSWTPPAGTNSSQCLIRITRNVTAEQATTSAFTINDQPQLSLNATQCPGYVNMHWTSTPNATGYTVFRKIGYYLQPVATTTDTFFYASALRTDSIYYFAVQPLFGTAKGFRSTGISRKPDNGTCVGSFSDNDLMMDAVTNPMTGRIGTQTALSSSQVLTLLIRNLDDASATSYKISYQINGGAWQTQTLSTLSANSSATVSFSGLNMAAAGTYVIRAAIQNLSGTDPVTSNDTIVTTVKQLQNNTLNLSSSAFTDDFESAPAMTLMADTLGFTSNERWDYYNSNDTGRLRTLVDNEITISGSRSLSMDILYQAGQPPAFNQLVGTFDLSSYTSASELRLEFDYKLHGKPKVADSNKVWVRGSDINTWVPLFAYDLNADPGKVNHTSSLSLTDALNAASQTFSSASQIRFGQFDTSLIESNTDGNGLSLDNVKLYLVNKDVGLSTVTAPAAVNCALGSSTPVTVTVFNGVNTSVSNLGLHYQLDGGTVVNETLASLAGKTSTSYTFTQNMNASASGAHLVKIWTDLNGDDVPGNGTIYFSFRNEPLITSFPYLENFESNDGYYWTEGTKKTWAWGTPAGQHIAKAASGVKAWKTNLNGYYNDREFSYLYSPCFNISGLTTPMLSFSLDMELENCGATLCDAAWVEYSIGGGAWTKLGANGQGTNWYSTSTYQVWNVETPVRWRVASIPLPTTSQTIRFRFVLSADEAVDYDGLAIDDIHIYDRTNPIYSGTAVGPITATVASSAFTNFTSGSALLAQISAGASSSLGSTDVTLYDHANIINTTSQQYFLPKNFVVNTQNAPTDSVIARLFITDADVVTLVNATGCSGCSKPADAYELGITKYDNANSSVENGSLSDNAGGTYMFIPYHRITWVPYDAGYYAQVKLASFSELWFNNGGPSNSFPLPIAGVDFDARKSGESSVLTTWLSHIDTQTMIYELQRSYDAVNWTGIATVPPARDNAHQYSYTDHPTATNASAFYYRLKYTLDNRKEYYSAVRQIIWSGRGASLTAYPNPTTNGEVRIDWNSQPGTSLEAQVTDITGRVVAQVSKVAADYANTLQLDLTAVAKGVYFLHATVDGERFDIKLVRR